MLSPDATQLALSVLALAVTAAMSFWLGQKSGVARQTTNDQQQRLLEQQQSSQEQKLHQSQLYDLQTELALARQQADQQAISLHTERQQFFESRQLLKQEFENLANRIFEQKQQSFSENSKQNMDLLLTPFRQQLESFRKRVDEVHTQNVQGQTHLKSELDRLHTLNQQMTTEASNLTRALKGDKKLQGNWGEHTVELLLEQAGLRKNVEYEREKNFRDEDGNARRPDFLIHLPEGKHIIIDSKVSLVDYTAYVAAETDELQQLSLAAHVQALRNHVTSLASKNYPELTGMQSPDFVFLFLGIEPSYIAALQHSPSLFQEAYEKRIAIVTASTLLPVLRVVANLWSLQRQNQNTRELAEQAGGIYEKLRIVVEKMEKLGTQLNTTQKTYAEAFNSLKDGRGNLLSRAEKFIELGVKVKQRLPAHLVETDLPDDDDHHPALPSDTQP